jgi:hypothetical protein
LAKAKPELNLILLDKLILYLSLSPSFSMLYANQISHFHLCATCLALTSSAKLLPSEDTSQGDFSRWDVSVLKMKYMIFGASRVNGDVLGSPQRQEGQTLLLTRGLQLGVRYSRSVPSIGRWPPLFSE